MTKQTIFPTQPSAEDTFGMQLVRELNKAEAALPRDITERLRAARMQAIAVHRENLAIAKQTTEHSAKGAKKPFTWWQRALATIPIVAAGAGAIFMQGAVSDDGLLEQIETDFQILSSEMPPSAYADPGFQQYLKQQQIELPHPQSPLAPTIDQSKR